MYNVHMTLQHMMRLTVTLNLQWSIFAENPGLDEVASSPSPEFGGSGSVAISQIPRKKVSLASKKFRPSRAGRSCKKCPTAARCNHMPAEAMKYQWSSRNWSGQGVAGRWMRRKKNPYQKGFQWSHRDILSFWEWWEGNRYLISPSWRGKHSSTCLFKGHWLGIRANPRCKQSWFSKFPLEQVGTGTVDWTVTIQKTTDHQLTINRSNSLLSIRNNLWPVSPLRRPRTSVLRMSPTRISSRLSTEPGQRAYFGKPRVQGLARHYVRSVLFISTHCDIALQLLRLFFDAARLNIEKSSYSNDIIWTHGKCYWYPMALEI